MGRFGFTVFGYDIGDFVIMEKYLPAILDRMIKKKKKISYFTGRNRSFDAGMDAFMRSQKEDKYGDRLNLVKVVPNIVDVGQIGRLQEMYDEVLIVKAVAGNEAGEDKICEKTDRWLAAACDLYITVDKRNICGKADYLSLALKSGAVTLTLPDCIYKPAVRKGFFWPDDGFDEIFDGLEKLE